MEYSERTPAGVYIFIFLIIMSLTALIIFGLGIVSAKNSPSVISANAHATAISRDSLGALMISAAQSYGISALAIGSVAILMTLVSTPLAIVAITISYLQMRRPNNNILIVAENRSQIRDVLPHVLSSGGDMGRIHTIINQQEAPHRRRHG